MIFESIYILYYSLLLLIDFKYIVYVYCICYSINFILILY